MGLLQDEDSSVRGNAADALGELSKKSSNVIPQIVQELKDYPDSEYIGEVIDALSNAVAGESGF